MTINFNNTVRFPVEFKSKLPNTSTSSWGDYVNAMGSNKSSHFHFERERSINNGLFGHYAKERPIWNVRYTHDGANYEVVGCVTAFDGDEIRCTFKLPDVFNPYGEQDDEDFVEYTASGSHPFEAFENAIAKYVARKGE